MATHEAVPGMGDAVERRRRQEGLTIGAFAKAAGLTRQALTDVRAGKLKNYEDKTIWGVARALRWPLDWYDRLRAGDDPQGFADTDHGDPPRSDAERLTSVEERLGRVEVAVQELLERGAP